MPRRARTLVVRAALLVLLVASRARADVAYVELLGKAGAYGLGYEHELAHPVSVGAAASYVVASGDAISTFAPYFHVTLIARPRNALFTELGVVVVHQKLESPVADWHGMATTGIGVFSGVGWRRELPRHLAVTTTLSAAAGRGGIAPMLGFSVGLRP